MLPLFFKGLRSDLSIHDLSKSPKNEESKLLADKLEK